MNERQSVIWDWPLRLWHWAFAAGIAFSLYSGLDGDIGLLEWHQRSGLVLLGLVLFRIGWAIWGGRYARFGNYRTTPTAFLRHFKGGATGTHTAPGIVLATVLLAAAALQVGTGLVATDDIFTEGPLHRYVSAEIAAAGTWIHHRLHWAILGLVSVHLLAHAIYGLVLRDRLPLAMFTGKKPATVPDTRHYWLRALVTAALATALALIVTYARTLFG